MSARKVRILVVASDPQIHRVLGPALNAAGYAHVRARTGRQGLELVARQPPPDAVLLDLRLPDFESHSAVQKLRQLYEGPIVVLSVRDREIEKIDALDAGADDYVEKPFQPADLLARLRVALHRKPTPSGAPPFVHAGNVTIDFTRRLVTRAGEPVHLTPTEYELLAKLARGDGRVLAHEELLISLRGRAHSHHVQYLRVYIGYLRQKIEADPSAPRLILTQPGVGYRFIAGHVGQLADP